MSQADPNPVVLLLTPDLIFGSRVQTAAGRAGVLVAASPSADKLLELVSENDPSKDFKLALVDLNHLQVDLATWIEDLRQRADGLPVVAFGSHVLEAKLQAARGAGCTQVLTRGQFDQQMHSLLAQVAKC